MLSFTMMEKEHSVFLFTCQFSDKKPSGKQIIVIFLSWRIESYSCSLSVKEVTQVCQD